MSNNSKKKLLPLPETVTSYRQDVAVEDIAKWVINSVVDPHMSSSDPVHRSMTVSPFEDEISRVFRVRELLRARVSLTTSEQVDTLNKLNSLDPKIVQAAEDYRLNCLLEAAGYSLSLLTDSPVHKVYGTRIAQIGTPEAFNHLVIYAIPLLETKAFNQLVTGVRSVNREWAQNLRRLNDSVKYGNSLRNIDSQYLGATKLETTYLSVPGGREEVKFPSGFMFTLRLAQQLMHHLEDENQLVEEKMSDEEQEKARIFVPGDPGEGKPFFQTNYDGSFEPLKFDTSKLTKTVKGYLHRKKTSMMYGKRILNPSRLLTDPQKRIFGQKVKANGGVVVIDISGSMSLEISDVNAILDAAPGAYVVAYSHGGASGRPNITVLANRGKQVERLNSEMFRGGNGCDGPALEHGVKMRKRNEPVVWISDGEVTGKNDGYDPNLHERVGWYMLRHNIIQIPSTDLAVQMFKSRKLRHTPTGAAGSAYKKFLARKNAR